MDRGLWIITKTGITIMLRTMTATASPTDAIPITGRCGPRSVPEREKAGAEGITGVDGEEAAEAVPDGDDIRKERLFGQG
jgi:hypothetical protein